MLELFLVFAKIGVMTFGGGLAMLPMLKYELVDKRGWVSEEELLDYYAIGQSTPGIIAVNTATFVGYKRKGVLGGIVATLGVVVPSVIIILVIASLLSGFAHIAAVQSALAGIRAVVCALLLGTVVTLVKRSVKDWFSIVVFVAVLASALFLPVPTVVLVVVCGVAGVVFSKIREARGK